jgi:hypothetical protein
MSILTDLLSLPGVSLIGARVDITMGGKTIASAEVGPNLELILSPVDAASVTYAPDRPEVIERMRRSPQSRAAREMQRALARERHQGEIGGARANMDRERRLRDMRDATQFAFFSGIRSLEFGLLTVEDLAHENGLRMEYVPVKGIPRIVHAGGRFRAAGGERFDYVFPELMKDPTLPRTLFPSVEKLAEGEPSFAPGLYIPRHSASAMSKAEVLFQFGCDFQTRIN